MNYEEIKKMIVDMGNSRVDELMVEFPDGIKIHMKKNSETFQGKQESVSRVCEEPVEIKEEKEAFKEIKAPMVGTFYSKSAPTADVFVKVGDRVKKGDTLCILEAMKLMNEIEAEMDGEIVEVCKQDEEMVEYGEVLFRLK